MKNKLLLLLLLFVISLASSAKEITKEMALNKAKTFLINQHNFTFKKTSEIILTDIGDIFNNKKISAQQGQELYVFNIGENQGFVIVSGDDATIPILGYSDEGAFTMDIPIHVYEWFEMYRKQIEYIRENHIEATDEIKKMWADGYMKKNTAVVTPLVTSKWSQSPYENKYCPYDDEYNELTVTGCGATAMAQIMNYWEYPKTGIGLHTYRHPKYGLLSAIFGETTYGWEDMPDVINSDNDAVATLMYHCGVSCEMNYNVSDEGGSGSYLYSRNDVPIEQTCENGYKAYFGYREDMRGISKSDYSESEYIQLLKHELDSKRPIHYRGSDIDGAHVWVCDGYDDNDFFHMNWGWGGYFDGYFSINSLTPSLYDFSNGQHALIGIQPKSDEELEKSKLDGILKFDDITIRSGETISGYIKVFNKSERTFVGDLCVVIVSENKMVVDTLSLLKGCVVPYSADSFEIFYFSNNDSRDLITDLHDCYILYREKDENWNLLGGRSAKSNIRVTGSKTSSYMSLVSDITISENPVKMGSEISIKATLKNRGPYEYVGKYKAVAYNDDNQLIEVIGETEELNLGSGRYYDVNFKMKGGKFYPGSYYVKIFCTAKDGYWEWLHHESGGTMEENVLYFDVYHDTALKLNSKIKIFSDEIYVGDTLAVTTSVLNTDKDPFYGNVILAIHKMNGEFIKIIDGYSLNDMPYNSYYNLPFLEKKIEYEPGRYFLLLWYNVNGGDYRPVPSSSRGANPLYFTIKEPVSGLDEYESNNDLDSSYDLQLNFVDDNAEIKTISSNVHCSNDVDYYKIKLDENYSYKIDLRLQDSYYNSDKGRYSLDAKFKYSLDGVNWSDYDDGVLDTEINVNGEANLYVAVSSYYIGGQGTYLLQGDIKRTSTLGTNQKESELVNIYPNPTNGLLNIQSEEDILYYSVYDIKGSILKKCEFNKKQIDISELNNGVYVLEFITDTKKRIVQKVVKQ